MISLPHAALTRRTLLLLFAAIAVLAVSLTILLLRDEANDQTKASSILSVEEVYRLVEEKLKADERVLVVEVESTFDGPYELSSHQQLWIDGSRELVRLRNDLEFRSDTETGNFDSESIVTATEVFKRDSDGDSQVASSRYHQCFGVGVATSELLGCIEPESEATIRVEEGRHKQRDVIVLVESGTSGGESPTNYTSRLYIDSKTLLPLEKTSEGSYEGDAAIVTFTSLTRFVSSTRVNRESLAAGFFEPAAIGYVPLDPEEAIRGASDLQVYWLGAEFSAPDIEPLILRGSSAAPDRGRPYKYSLTYARASNPHEPPQLSLMIFHKDMWERSPAIAAQAVVLGDVVVFFNEGNFPGASPILTPSTLETLKQALQPYAAP